MPQIDFTIFFIFALWIFPIFFAGFYYSLVYVYPVFVLWNKVILCLTDLSFSGVIFFERVRSLVGFKYIYGV